MENIIDELRRIREKHYEETKNLSIDEKNRLIHEKAEKALQEMNVHLIDVKKELVEA